MADLFDNDFADAAPPATQTTPEEDPAAAFLAREENEIAGKIFPLRSEKNILLLWIVW